MKKYYPQLIIVGVFSLTTLVLFGPTIFLDKVPLPTDLVDDYLLDEPKVGENALIRDSVVQLYPNLHVMFSDYKSGMLSGYNPFIFSGLDMKATGQSALWSPLNLLIPLFSQPLGFFKFIVIFYFLLSGFSMYWLLRGLGNNWNIALLGGVIFQLSGPLLGWMAWGTISGVIAWVPLLLLAVHNFTASRKIRWLVLFTFVNFASLTAGHYQFYLYGLLVTLVYGGYRLLSNRKHFKKLNWTVSILAISINATIIYLITKPFLSAMALSHRTGISDTSRLSIKNLFQFIYPNIWGDVNNYTGPLNYLESLGYIGLVPFVVIIFGIITYKFTKWNQLWFWIGIFAVTLLYNLVPEITTPLHYVFPFLDSFPPFRSIFIIDITLIILMAGILQQKLAQTSKRTTITIGCLIIVSFTSQFLALGNFTPQQAPGPLVEPPAYVNYLQTHADKPLIYSELSPLNLYSLYGVRSIFGYDSTYSQEYYQMIKEHGEIISHKNILNAKITDRDFLRTLGVEYVVTKRDLKNLEPVFEENEIKVYEL